MPESITSLGGENNNTESDPGRRKFMGDVLKGATAVAAGAVLPNRDESLLGFSPVSRSEKETILEKATCSIEGVGSELGFAEPGVLLFGPDMDVVEAKRLRESRVGDYFSPLNQISLNRCDIEGNSEPTAVSLDEGSFVWFTGARFNLKVKDSDLNINVDGPENNNWFVVLKGKFADGKQDSDLNQTVIASNYESGHAQAMRMPPGAFISEGQLRQVAEASHTGLGGVTGKEGASDLNVLVLDTNTGAYTWFKHTHLTGEDPGPWETVASNISGLGDPITSVVSGVSV